MKYSRECSHAIRIFANASGIKTRSTQNPGGGFLIRLFRLQSNRTDELVETRALRFDMRRELGGSAGIGIDALLPESLAHLRLREYCDDIRI